jgi:hypothetical protein
MKTYRNVLVILTAVAMLAMLFGCAGSQKRSYSGFLDDYSQLKKGPGDIDLRYLKAGVDFKKYNKVMLDEVAFFLSPESKYQGLKASEVKELSDAFYEIYIETLGNIFTDKPGPGVVRMRLALTNIERSNPVSGTMTTVVPVGLAVSVVSRGATGEYVGIGSATAEVECLDSLTNERIAAGVDTMQGGKLDVGELNPVKSAFKYWATGLKNFIDSQMNMK